jgi:sugar/nucleoside kinase (ribokinase family)
MIDAIICGEALIDFLPVTSVDGRPALESAAGGSCLNVAIGMVRLGAATGFVGGISTDLFGRMIADHAERSEVDVRYAARIDCKRSERWRFGLKSSMSLVQTTAAARSLERSVS